MTPTACLVGFISTVNDRNKKRKEKNIITSGASSGHITKLKQSIILRCLWVQHHDYATPPLTLVTTVLALATLVDATQIEMIHLLFLITQGGQGKQSRHFHGTKLLTVLLTSFFFF
jgi:hypothetical protein